MQSFPIPLRILFAAHPELLTSVLRIVHRVITRFLLKQAGLKRSAADAGSVTLIQRFGSAANLSIHLHCLVLDELQGLLDRIIARLMKMLTRQGYLVEEEGMTYLADIDADNPLVSLQAAACTYRSALGLRAGQKVLSLGAVSSRDKKNTAPLRADAHGFSLHAAVRTDVHQRKRLGRLCRYITRLAIANGRFLERTMTAWGRYAKLYIAATMCKNRRSASGARNHRNSALGSSRRGRPLSFVAMSALASGAFDESVHAVGTRVAKAVHDRLLKCSPHRMWPPKLCIEHR